MPVERIIRSADNIYPFILGILINTINAEKHKNTPIAVIKTHSGKDKISQNQTFNTDTKIERFIAI